MAIKASFRGLFILTSSTLIILKLIFSITSIYSTSRLMMYDQYDDHHHFDLDPLVFARSSSEILINSQTQRPPSAADDDDKQLFGLPPGDGSNGGGSLPEGNGSRRQRGGGEILSTGNISDAVMDDGGRLSATAKTSKVKQVYHDKDMFLENYKHMNKTFKIYIYPHPKTDPFANIFLPNNHDSPGGNYASESYFKIRLSTSHFVTTDPSEADLFFLPFSIACMRQDERIGVGRIKSFIQDYISSISHNYPFWNRTGGADHFYVTCHSIGRTAMEKTPEVSINAIQVVCSSSYFLQGYTPHKDASMPQIWPRLGTRPTRHPSKRKMLAFYAGEMNSKVRKSLIQTWINDTQINVHPNRLKTPYTDSLLGSKFCIHAKGFEVNTARVADAIYHGCVPVVLADHYDLPFADILDWTSFSVVVPTDDIPLLKSILGKIVDSDEYIMLQKNVVMVQKHFQWHQKPTDFDTFYMVMYELWLRRSALKMHEFN